MIYPVLTHRNFSRACGSQVPVDESVSYLTRKAAAALAGLALVTLQTHYDMSAFRLRALLQQIDALAASDQPLHSYDAAVLLWRLQVLDRHNDTHFLTGLSNLRAWGKRLLAQDFADPLRAPMAAQRFLSQQRALGGLLSNPQRDELWGPICKAS